jgi:DNA (cytosine-5)-methyltransferase 1
MPTFGSLFSGIGGLDLGLERAGWECRWQVELDPFCRRVLTKHWPDVPKYTDVKVLDGRELEPVDLIAGGFPCQPVSLAGHQRAQADARWLWPEFARLIRMVRPRVVLAENVPGLLVHGMGDVLSDLADLGFDAEWTVLSAAQFGAHHLRRRLFIVAYPAGGDGVDVRGGRCHVLRPPAPGQTRDAGTRGVAVADTNGTRLAVGPRFRGDTEQERAPVERDGGDWRGIWATEPAVGRVVDGLPFRVDRLRGLGNAVVPQVAEWLGHRLLTALEAA